MIEIGDEVIDKWSGDLWVIMGYVYYDNCPWYIGLNTKGEEKDLHGNLCQKVSP